MTTRESEIDLEKWLEEVRSGEFRKWTQGNRDRVVNDASKMDEVRRLVTDQDIRLITWLYSSPHRDDVLLAHTIGRAMVRKHGPLRKLVEIAYGEWEIDIHAKVCLAHDLMEDASWLERHSEEYVNFVSGNYPAVREVVLSFMKERTEEEMVRLFAKRLEDTVNGDGTETMNSPGKAFVYPLYFGFLEDRKQRGKARELLETLKDADKGDDLFKKVVGNVLEFLKQPQV